MIFGAVQGTAQFRGQAEAVNRDTGCRRHVRRACRLTISQDFRTLLPAQSDQGVTLAKRHDRNRP